jgi:hypothetical protein
MNSAIFSTSSESFQVYNIIYAGPVVETPEELQKMRGSTHSFKIMTPQTSVFCYYKTPETARNARNALGAMVKNAKPSVFRLGDEALDPKAVISYGNVYRLKTPQGEKTHFFVATMDTADERNRKVWLKYRSEESARKAKNALFAAIHAVNDVPLSKPETPEGDSVTEEAEPLECKS